MCFHSLSRKINSLLWHVKGSRQISFVCTATYAFSKLNRCNRLHNIIRKQTVLARSLWSLCQSYRMYPVPVELVQVHYSIFIRHDRLFKCIVLTYCINNSRRSDSIVHPVVKLRSNTYLTSESRSTKRIQWNRISIIWIREYSIVVNCLSHYERRVTIYVLRSD